MDRDVNELIAECNDLVRKQFINELILLKKIFKRKKQEKRGKNQELTTNSQKLIAKKQKLPWQNHKTLKKTSKRKLF